MIYFIKKTKFLAALFFVSLCYTSCTKENLDDETEISSFQTDTDLKPEENVDFDSYQYNYQDKLYSLSEINRFFPLLLEKSFVIFDDQDIAYVFDNEIDAVIHDGAISKAADCRSDGSNDTWGFKIRFYEHENYRGRWWQYRKHRISVHTFKVGGNVPSWLNDRTSSIVLDELDYSKHRSDFNFIGMTCYEDYNQRGRQTYARATNVFLHKLCNKTFENLRKDDWNDKISSWTVNGGGGR